MSTLTKILLPDNSLEIVSLTDSTELEELPTLDVTALNELPIREFIVILKNYDDLDSFYNDMETEGGSLHIPDRVVELAARRPISRNTHYYLTQAEADRIKNDSRVQDVVLTHVEQGIQVTPLSEYSTSWSKDAANLSQDDKNWGLLRSYNKSATANWGSDGTTNIAGTINLTNVGRNVDVVICDGHIPPGHPEFAVNENGTGGSRVNQYNWFIHNPTVTGGPTGTYVYDFPSGELGNNNHGTHVAGTAAGNTQGWARKANIYNISPYGSQTNAVPDAQWTYHVIDYIRAFHNAKAVNPATGVKNPTIVNLSWGLTGTMDLANPTYMQFQGNTYAKPGGGWSAYRGFLGLVAASSGNPNIMLFMSRDSSLDVDITDAIADGIIIVGAAGNYLMYNDVPGGLNYNNAFIVPNLITLSYDYTFYMRGPSPGAAPGVIHVSAIDSTVTEQKADYSNAGPRTDIFSPGSIITSSHISPGISDTRNASYYIDKLSGTSMATPQVTGLLACALEIYPKMTPADALAYITRTATTNQLVETFGGNIFLSYHSLLNGPNKFVAYTKEKLDNGATYPKINYTVRPTSGAVYPRVRRRIKG
jgi:hypothetical protein